MFKGASGIAECAYVIAAFLVILTISDRMEGSIAVEARTIQPLVQQNKMVTAPSAFAIKETPTTSVISLTNQYSSSPNWYISFNTTKYWNSVSVSEAGNIVYACVGGYGEAGHNGYIWQSLDFGLSWNQLNVSNQVWQAVVTSGSGQYVFAAVNPGSSPGGLIYGSTDTGVSWTVVNSDAKTWWGLAALEMVVSYLLLCTEDTFIAQWIMATLGKQAILTTETGNLWSLLAMAYMYTLPHREAFTNQAPLVSKAAGDNVIIQE